MTLVATYFQNFVSEYRFNASLLDSEFVYLEDELASTGLDDDIIQPLTERETDIHSYLLRNESLPEETMDHYITKFWKEEPFK